MIELYLRNFLNFVRANQFQNAQHEKLKENINGRPTKELSVYETAVNIEIMGC